MPSLKRGAILLALALALLPAVRLALGDDLLKPEVLDPEITAEELLAHIKFMASDDLEGRAAGAPGALVTAEYLAAYFEAAGLEPLGDEGTFYQNFSLPQGFQALPSTSVTSECGSRKSEFRFGEDITVMPSSAAGQAQGSAVFAGYGVSAPMYGYDDYEGLDAAGKIVVILRGIPGGQRGPVGSREAVRTFGTRKAKQDTAAGLGAAALIIVNDPAEHGSKKTDVLIESGRESQGAIPYIHMTYRAGSKLLAGTGISLGRLQARIDKTKKPASREAPDLTVDVNAGIEPIELKVRNVVGVLRAKSPEKLKEAVAVGGHFDHVGLGEFGSRGGSKALGEVHNGADDNASGTAALIEIASHLSARAEELKRDVVFIGFTAEEMGLHGSEHYVGRPPIPLAETVAMINLDMIGRLERGDLFIGGVGTSPVFEKLLEEANRETRIKLTFGKGGRAPTDSTSFYNKEVPVLFFFTGLHADYHLPDDDWKEIDERGCEKVVRLAAQVAFDLATRAERPPFTRADSGGFRSGPHLGLTVAQKADGLYVSDVEAKSPASKAGFRVDDRVLEFEGEPVQSAADFYGIKARCPPGKRVTILIRREGRIRQIKVKLGK